MRTDAPEEMHRSGDREKASILPAALVGVAFAVFMLVVGAAASAALLFGARSGCGEEAVGSVEGVPAKLVPIYRSASERYGLGERGPSILAAINWVETELRLQSLRLLGRSRRMDAVHSLELGDLRGRRERRRGQGPLQPLGRDLRRRASTCAPRARRATGTARSSPTTTPSGTWRRSNGRPSASAGRRRGRRRSPKRVAGVGSPSGATLDQAVRLSSPRAFKPLPSRLWVGGGAPESVDARIWPDAVWLLESFDLRVTAAREVGHQTHGDGTAMDMVPAAGRSWDETALRAALALGWIPSCGASGSAPVCPLVPAIQFIGYNGYPGHGDPAHAGDNAHLHVSWKSSDYRLSGAVRAAGMGGGVPVGRIEAQRICPGGPDFTSRIVRAGRRGEISRRCVIGWSWSCGVGACSPARLWRAVKPGPRDEGSSGERRRSRARSSMGRQPCRRACC